MGFTNVEYHVLERCNFVWILNTRAEIKADEEGFRAM